MRSGIRHLLSVIVLASVAVAATGCNHDTLGGASQELSVRVSPNPAGAGRYESASFIVNKLQVLPVNTAAASLYGTEQLRLRRDPYTADLTGNQEVEISRIALSTGNYRVSLLELAAPVLIDQDVSATPVSCIEGIAVIDGQKPPGQVPPTFTFTDEPSLNFTIRPGQKKLTLTVNVPGLIAGYESSYTCQLGCGPGGSPCLTAFSAASFKAAVLANVTLE